MFVRQDSESTRLLLNLVFTNEENAVDCKHYLDLEPVGNSDHCTLGFTYYIYRVTEKQSGTMKYKYDKGDDTGLSNFLVKVNWQLIIQWNEPAGCVEYV